jgi:hypothetical protein
MTCGFDDLTATPAAVVGRVDHGVTAIYGAETSPRNHGVRSPRQRAYVVRPRWQVPPVIQDGNRSNCQRCGAGLSVYQAGRKLSGRLANPRSTIPGAG